MRWVVKCHSPAPTTDTRRAMVAETFGYEDPTLLFSHLVCSIAPCLVDTLLGVVAQLNQDAQWPSPCSHPYAIIQYSIAPSFPPASCLRRGLTASNFYPLKNALLLKMKTWFFCLFTLVFFFFWTAFAYHIYMYI